MRAKPYSVEVEHRIALTGLASPEELDTIGQRSTLTCPECGGVIWRIGTDSPLRYRCHTGHAFSQEVLTSAQTEGLEGALWTTIRKAEERAALALHQVKRAKLKGTSKAFPYTQVGPSRQPGMGREAAEISR